VSYFNFKSKNIHCIAAGITQLETIVLEECK